MKFNPDLLDLNAAEAATEEKAGDIADREEEIRNAAAESENNLDGMSDEEKEALAIAQA